MKESSTYQAVLREGREEGRAEGETLGIEKGRRVGREEGRAEEARRMILGLGSRILGPLDPVHRAALESITNPERLEQINLRLADAASWEELLSSETQSGD